MSTTLKSIPATVAPDGTVTLAEPLEITTTVAAMVTVAYEQDPSDEIEGYSFDAATAAVFAHYDPLLKELAK